jgi:L-iditol 2-dehydrogenase
VRGLTKLAPGVGNVGLAERDEREPEPGEALLEVRAAGICGTDLHIEAGEYPSVPPVTMGHEVCGVVLRGGGFEGTRVVSETYFSTCRTCDFCLAGRPNLCLERRSIGTHVDGAFAPRLVVPLGNLHPIPDWLPDHAAALIEPLACVCNALFDPPVVAPGDEVLVLGPGAIGLLAAQAVRAAGGRVTVVGTDRDTARLELAAKLGLEACVPTTQAPLVAQAQAAPAVATGTSDVSTRSRFDVVVECSGSEAGIASGLQATRRGGRFVQIGLRGTAVTVPWDEICFRELVVTSGFASTPASWRRALALIEARAIELEPLVTEVVPLEEWERAFRASRNAEGVKYVLDPR